MTSNGNTEVNNAVRLSAIVAPALLLLSCVRTADVPRGGSADGTVIPRGPPVAGAPQPHQLAGAWVLEFETMSPAGRGLQLAVTVDSGDAAGFYGRVSHFFSGNMGIDPRIFRPFRGTLIEGLVDLAVEPATEDAPRLHILGHLSGDTIRLERFTIGRDTVEAGGERSSLIRSP